METETMTIREIAELTGNGKATIQDWIAKMNGNNSITNEIRSSIATKVADAVTTKKPAEFTLIETVAIVRAGGNELLANLLEQNAKLSFDDIEASDEPENLVFTGPGGNAVNLKTLSALLEVDDRTIRRRADELGIRFIRGKSPAFDRGTAVKMVYMVYQRKSLAECERILKKVTAYFGTANVPAVGGMKNVPSNMKDEVIRRMVECLNLLTGGEL